MTANGCSSHPHRTAGCPACQTISRIYERRRRSAIADGTWLRSVDAADVKAHLDELIAAGMSVTVIADRAGLPKRSVLGVRHRKYVQGPTAAALFAVKPETVAAAVPAGMVPVIGASRRVQGLAWMGWSLQAQADQIGMYIQQVWQVAHAKQAHVTESTHATFSDLFEQWSATRGPSKRAHSSAVRKAWVPPLAWDDIDDPNDTPRVAPSDTGVIDEVAVRRALEGERLTLSGAEQVVALQRGIATGAPLSVVSGQLGINYAGARTMLGGELTPQRQKRAAVEAELLRAGDALTDSAIGALVGVHHQTVTRARARLARRELVAS